MKIVCLSDTHGYHRLVKDIPDGDVLIVAGDLTNDAGKAALRDFCLWMNTLPHKHKVFIAGNHDWAFEKWPDKALALVKDFAPTCHYLQDSSVVLDGVKFYGSPWTPRFFDWAFNADRGDVIKQHWDKIDKDTDVLITHGPAAGCGNLGANYQRVDVGCYDLRQALQRIQPKLHVCGHVHPGYGKVVINWPNQDPEIKSLKQTICVNAATCDEAYKPTRKPIVVEI